MYTQSNNPFKSNNTNLLKSTSQDLWVFSNLSALLLKENSNSDKGFI